jgi:sigma-E factor negative regulatory protein RseA
MSEQLRESVSALMDGEAEELELRRLLAEANTDQVNDLWSRYHLARDHMSSAQDSQSGIGFGHMDISQRVSEAIAKEPVVTSRSSGRVPGWLQPVAGFAVAASVAVAVVIGVQQQVVPAVPAVDTSSSVVASATNGSSRVYPLQIGAQSSTGSALSTVSLTGQGVLPGALAASQTAADLAAQQMLDKYILRHTEQASINNGQGIISYARVTSFEE